MRELKNKKIQESPNKNDGRPYFACNDEKRQPLGERPLLQSNLNFKLLDQFYFSGILLDFYGDNMSPGDSFLDHHWKINLLIMKNEFKRYCKVPKEIMILQKSST